VRDVVKHYANWKTALGVKPQLIDTQSGWFKQPSRSRSALWIIFLAVSAITLAIAAILVLRDRQDAIDRAADQTASISRLIVAHADAAIAVADRIVSAASPAVARWDLADPQQAEDITALLKSLVAGNGIVSSAAVISANGDVLVTSRFYPPKPLNISDRPFLKAHRAAAADPVIMGDSQPGPISGKRRFTFSRAGRAADGSLRSIISAAIETDAMDILYSEAANWRGGQAGLYGRNGDVLAQAQTASLPSPAFLSDLGTIVASSAAAAGTAEIQSDAAPRLVSWARSQRNPEIYSATSQSMEQVLKEWRSRLWTTGITVTLLILAFWALGQIAIRRSEARQLARMNELALREVHHRLKNSLQLIGSLIHMRSRKFSDPAWQQETTAILNDLRAVADVHALLQAAPGTDTIDVAEVTRVLCEQLADTYHADIKHRSSGPIPVAGSHATGLSIIINELVTNAIKHGQGDVSVDCRKAAGQLVIEVTNSAVKLLDQPVFANRAGFGLRAVQAMVNGFGGTFSARSNEQGLTVLSIQIPLSSLAALPLA
jgi:two-component sensor histidine kinase